MKLLKQNESIKKDLIKNYRLRILIKSYIITAISAGIVAMTLFAATDAYAYKRHNLPRHSHNLVRHPERAKSYQAVRKLHARINKLRLSKSRRGH